MRAARRRGDGPSRALPAGALLVGVLLLGACGPVDDPGPGNASPSGDPTAVADGIAGFPRCADVPWIRAEESRYRDEPVYGNAEALRSQVHGWAATQPGFVELGLDRERNGWITIWVKDADAAALQEEVAHRWPGEGIVVVDVPWTIEELEALRTEVDAALQAAGVRTAGSALLPQQGVAEIALGVVGPEAEEVLADFAGRPLCVDGIPAGEAPERTEQATAGEGWRLLDEGPTGEAYRTAVATTDDQLRTIWQSAGLDGDPAEVDWDHEIAVWFGAAHGSGCPVRFDGVVVAGDLVHAELVVPDEIYGCPDDANPHAFVVALARDLLPAGPFRVQLEARDPYPGTPEELTVVDVDLTGPGSTATDEQLHTGTSSPEPPLVADGDDLPADRPARYVYRTDPACDSPVIGPLDGSVWRPADREAPWEVADGEELTLHPLGGSDDEMVASGARMDWLLVRLPDGRTCP